MNSKRQINPAYQKEIKAWQRDMDEQMRAPGPWGWLAIIGSYPLKQGFNTIGSHPESDIILPKLASPEHVGSINFQGNHGSLKVITPETVTVDGVAVKEIKLRNHYEAGGMSVVKVRNLSFGIMQWASDPYNVRVWDANSSKRLNFKGRAWFPINPRYRVKGVFTPHLKEQAMTVEHTGGETQQLINTGTIEFELFGQSFKFQAAASELGKDYIWLLMRDETSGRLTYGAGRFMMVALANDNTVDVDFNKLYHPPCAFCDYTTCPMPPRGNVLPFAIEAGEHFPT